MQGAVIVESNVLFLILVQFKPAPDILDLYWFLKNWLKLPCLNIFLFKGGVLIYGVCVRARMHG